MFSILELRGCSMFLFLTVPIFDKMQEGRGAKLINFGNQVIGRRETSGAIRPADFVLGRGSRERRQRQECFHRAQTTPMMPAITRIGNSPKQEHNSDN
jgi:hypothetical protein